MSSIRDKATSAKLDSERVHVDAWDVDVEVRAITVEQRRAIQESDDDRTSAALRLLVASVYDPESGELAFTDDDLGMLAGQAAGAIDGLLEVVIRVSGLDRNAVEAGKADS